MRRRWTVGWKRQRLYTGKKFRGSYFEAKYCSGRKRYFLWWEFVERIFLWKEKKSCIIGTGFLFALSRMRKPDEVCVKGAERGFINSLANKNCRSQRRSLYWLLLIHQANRFLIEMDGKGVGAMTLELFYWISVICMVAELVISLIEIACSLYQFFKKEK